ncbi:ATP-binding cassette domain-containing protein [Floricoccus penangensis]|uniref:ATP-binding cassette domain-containing protein n=1 Tax=Floricoccus penangensis TaxID=1859475 RepID=UPI002040E83B|nr:ABC transporter ATP-binding protein [Floricoccus penangensis]URZ87025.1 ABC transporter ATP-binding protein/permease [Floricoccus penangensis]
MKKYILKHKGLNILLLTIIIVVATMQTSASLLIIPLTSALKSGESLKFFKLIVVLGLLYLIWIIANFFKIILQAKITQIQINDIRNDILVNISNMDYQEFHSRKAEDYVSWITNDMNMIETEVFDNYYIIIECIIEIILTLFAFAQLNLIVLSSVFVLGTIMAIVPNIYNKKMKKAVSKISEENEEFTFISSNYLTGFDLLFHNGRTLVIITRIRKVYQKLKKAKINQSKVQASMMASVLSLNVFAQLTTLSFTGYYIIQGSLALGAFMTVSNLSSTFYNNIQSMISAYSRAKANGNILDKYPVVERDDLGISKDFDNLISSKNLTYKYNDKSTITYPSFTFSKGKKYALIGSSGSGKSTLFKLLIGDLRKYQGDLNFDNDSYSELNVSSLHNNISIVDQSSHIFSDTVRNNLTLGLEFTDQEIREATNKAQITDYIESLENGYETILKDTGDLSGGQAQRLSLARALLFNRNIFLIDEGTSSLDKENARKVEDTILKMKDKTVIMITHHLREESKKDFDEVIELS